MFSVIIYGRRWASYWAGTPIRLNFLIFTWRERGKKKRTGDINRRSWEGVREELCGLCRPGSTDAVDFTFIWRGRGLTKLLQMRDGNTRAGGKPLHRRHSHRSRECRHIRTGKIDWLAAGVGRPITPRHHTSIPTFVYSPSPAHWPIRRQKNVNSNGRLFPYSIWGCGGWRRYDGGQPRPPLPPLTATPDLRSRQIFKREIYWQVIITIFEKFPATDSIIKQNGERFANSGTTVPLSTANITSGDFFFYYFFPHRVSEIITSEKEKP